MLSRQERRKRERDAAKRPPAKTGATGAAAARTARASVPVNVNPLGEWTTQTANPNDMLRALGRQTLLKRAAEGDGEAQYSLGFRSMGEAAGVAGTPIGTGGRSPEADVGCALCSAHFPVAHQVVTKYK